MTLTLVCHGSRRIMMKMTLANFRKRAKWISACSANFAFTVHRVETKKYCLVVHIGTGAVEEIKIEFANSIEAA